ncbi:MAG TPA: XrtA/PEP-CTERM system histidine kinase PrsK [Verrucomicrobiae bacterium]|nr:XrtA/PEP-CTERM system histidine kinase PrsK [Verrucomicrobiae bacterium]
MDSAATLYFLTAAVAGGVATFEVWREARRLSAWLFAVGLLLLAAQFACSGMAELGVTGIEKADWESWRLLGYAFLPSIWIAFSLTFARGNPRKNLKQWRILLGFMIVVPVLIAALFRDKLVASLYKEVFETEWKYRVSLGSYLLYLVWLLAVVLVMVNLERTVRASMGMMRWRIKYMIMGLGAFFCVDAYISTQVLIFRSVEPSLQKAEALALLLGGAMTLRSIWRTGGAVTVYPGPGLWQGSVTLFVGGLYLFVIGAFSKLDSLIGGERSFSFKAFIILALFICITVLALSDHARLRLRQFVSRYFQTSMYDYRAVWRAFTSQVSPKTNEAELCKSAVELVNRYFDILSVSLWLVDEKKENLLCAASTSLSPADAQTRQPPTPGAQDVIRHLQAHTDPITLDKNKAPWAEVLRQCHPVEFAKSGDRVCVPLTAGGNLLGVLLLGDRVGGMSFSLQDFDLLRCVGDQVAASLLNARLSKRLLQHKEMEAFQAMSTFFVHDLKNLASTLNLMLKNLPVHFDNPEFRADALRGIGKTCDHINHLISRLSLLREGLQITPVEADLNQVLTNALADCPTPPGIELQRRLAPAPKLLLDAEQFEKVITNLVLNAIEAMSAGGLISVESAPRDGWAVVTVTDTGSGMDPEFMSRALFRPFQTTKKKGLGIGMFQSKMIVEAHGGRIEVESQRGKGSTFRVLLPLPNSTA